MIKEHTMPCIHMNGSGKDSLRRQYNELFEAVSETLIKLLYDTDFHQRDYYPLGDEAWDKAYSCLLYTSPSPRDRTRSRMPSSA